MRYLDTGSTPLTVDRAGQLVGVLFSLSPQTGVTFFQVNQVDLLRFFQTITVEKFLYLPLARTLAVGDRIDLGSGAFATANIYLSPQLTDQT